MRRTSVPRSLQEVLGDDGTTAFVEVFNRQQDQMTDDIARAVMRALEPRFASIEARLDQCATKADLAGFATQSAVDRLAEKQEAFAVALERGFGSLRAEMANQRADMMKWMFLFWVGQAFVVLAYLRAAQ